MKKFVSIALALALALSLTVVAFATVTTTGDTTKKVNLDHTDLAFVDTYAAEIVWAVNDVAYGEGSKTWDTTNMKWGEIQGAAWSDADAGKVTVKNFSSQAITVTVEDNSEYITVNGGTSVDAAAEPVEGAEKGTAGTAEWTFTASGAPKADAEITFTVTIA